MMWLKLLGKILNTLREGASPRQIAGGFVLGFALGLIPGWPLQAFLLLAVIFFLNVNLTMAGVGAALATAVALLFDPVFNAAGGWVLEAGFLHGLWTAAYNTPVFALARFNNTVVMGSTVLGVVGAVIWFPILIWAVKVYRQRVLAWINKLWIVRAVTGSRLFLWFARVASLGATS